MPFYRIINVKALQKKHLNRLEKAKCSGPTRRGACVDGNKRKGERITQMILTFFRSPMGDDGAF